MTPTLYATWSYGDNSPTEPIGFILCRDKEMRDVWLYVEVVGSNIKPQTITINHIAYTIVWAD